jgi:hypothetical protein
MKPFIMFLHPLATASFIGPGIVDVVHLYQTFLIFHSAYQLETDLQTERKITILFANFQIMSIFTHTLLGFFLTHDVLQVYACDKL